MEKVGEGGGRWEKGWRRWQRKVGEGLRKLEKVGEGGGKWGKVGERLEKVAEMHITPKEFHQF